jgi:lysophospholipase L1-like esterase
MTVSVGPGELAASNGAQLSVAATKLSFDPPEVRAMNLTAKATRDYADWFDPWEPWPRKGKDGLLNTIDLKADHDEDGVLILGGFFRMVHPESVKVSSADGTKTFRMGEDFKYNEDWGQIANLGGRLGKQDVDELKVSCQYATQRIDLIQVDVSGKASVKKGQARMVCPMIPAPDTGATAVAGVYVAPWKRDGKFVISAEDIYPIRPAVPVAPIHREAVAKTLQKLQAGQEVRIAIMGASIELGAEACAWWDDKVKFTDRDLAYRGRVVVGLRKRFPKATVTPIEAYEGGTQTKFGLQVLEEKVIPGKADLVLIGFGGNDVSGPIGKGPNNPPDQFKKDILAMVQQAKAAGMEVMLVVTMQQNPWAKDQVAQRWPKYREALLEIGAEEKVAVADVYTEWMNLAARGIPPFSQLHNWINHPGPFGHGVYADVVLRFFD